jgi:hypothetical protein
MYFFLNMEVKKTLGAGIFIQQNGFEKWERHVTN